MFLCDQEHPSRADQRLEEIIFSEIYLQILKISRFGFLNVTFSPF